MRRIGMTLVAGVALLAGCGDGGGEARVEPAGDLRAGAFEVVASSVAGDDVDLAAYAGRDVVVWFWSPW